VKRFGGFITATICVCGLGAFAVGLAKPGNEVLRAVWASALIVVIVQAVAFSLVRMMGQPNVIAGWGLGMIVRFIALITYGLVGVKALGLSMQPALLSMAGFFFVTTLLEPVFLKP